MSKKINDAIFWAVIGTLVVISAVTGLGTEAGWWAYEFPFWPVMFVWVGFGIVVESIRKLRNPEKNLGESAKSWC